MSEKGAGAILDEAAEKQGWDEESQISVLLEYINNQGDTDAFAEFIQRKILDESYNQE